MFKKTIALFLLSILSILNSVGSTEAYFNITHGQASISIQIGSWTWGVQFPPFNPSETYTEGDIFTYDGRVWIVRADWFNNSQFLNPDGTVNESYLRPYGPVNEYTTEYRPYNTYENGDIVTYQGYEWRVVHQGAHLFTPGSNTNAWFRISSEWFQYNEYQVNDEVNYNGDRYRAISVNWNKPPSQYIWAWAKI